MARSILLGTALGVGTRLVYHGPAELIFLHTLGAPWLAAAFAVGALRAGARSGAVHGALALVVAVLAYYALPELLRHPYPASGIGVAWIWIALPAGALFGAAGALWRAGGPWALPSAALLVGTFFGEAAIAFGRDKQVAFTLEFCAAAALLALLFRRKTERLAVAAAGAVIAVAAAVAEVGVYLSLGYLVG